MVKPTLKGCEAKLWWAEQHLKILDRSIRDHFKAHPYEIITEQGNDAREYRFRVSGLVDVNPSWSNMIGDTLYSLRSCLDNLVYQLAILRLGRDLMDAEAESCAFPVCSDPQRFPENRVKLLRPGEQTRIRELQPFNAWDASIWGKWPGIPATLPDALARLHAFENVDEHRHPHPVWWRGITDAEEPPIMAVTVRETRPLKDNAEIGHWRLDADAKLRPNMDMKPYFPLGIGFGEAAMPNDAVTELDTLTRAVSAVLMIFRPCIHGEPAMPLSSWGDFLDHDLNDIMSALMEGPFDTD